LVAQIIEPAKQKTARARRGLMLVCALCIVAIVVEVVGGLYAHSLAILTDAAHLLSDLAGFLISLFALWFTTKAPTS
jgi:zinc transporter 2